MKRGRLHHFKHPSEWRYLWCLFVNRARVFVESLSPSDWSLFPYGILLYQPKWLSNVRELHFSFAKFVWLKEREQRIITCLGWSAAKNSAGQVSGTTDDISSLKACNSEQVRNGNIFLPLIPVTTGKVEKHFRNISWGWCDVYEARKRKL